MNITTDESETGVGLFSAISGEDTIVQNLIVEGTVNAENSQTAGLIAGIVGDGASIINCQAGSEEDNTSSITATYEGGLVGYLMGSGSIEQSRNYASVSNPEGSGTNLGGIVGTVNHASDPNNSLSITNCYNYGNITGNGYAGGIAGFVSGAEITNCYNESDSVIESYRQSIGGIAGYVSENTSIAGCTNSGTIKVREGYGNINSAIGGIAGFVNSGSGANSISISSCTNDGKFEFNTDATEKTYQAIGGIAGVLMNATVNSSTNQADIKAPEGVTLNSVGGITGSLSINAVISSDSNDRSVNNGDISGNNRVGGIAGSVAGNSTVEYAENNGELSGTTEVGGIAGRISSSTIRYTNNNAEGSISGEGYQIGGIVGYMLTDANSNIPATIESSNNSGTVSGTNSYRVGGIVGYSNGSANVEFSIKDSDNSGPINGNSTVGGIAGQIRYTKIDSCDNTAAVTGTESTENSRSEYGTGGIVGIGLYSTLTGCNNSGTIKAAIRLGGIIGTFAGNDNSLASSENTGDLTIISESLVANGRHFGGAIGNCKNLTANDVTVSGNITLEGNESNTKYIGGFVGCISTSSTFTNCNADNMTNNTGISSSKGFVGHGGPNGTYNNCSPNDANSGIPQS